MYYLIFIIVFVLLFVIYNKKRENFVICLMYHDILNYKVNGIITTEEFEEHMKYISQNYKNTYKFEELEKLGYKLSENSILITFDDGYKNNYINAFPILKKYEIKATIFINTKYIGNSDYYLNWDEIKEMYESGLIDFQLHTHSHGQTIRKIEVKGFFDNKIDQYFKRESYNLFFNGIYNHENDKNKMDGLPIFKTRSQIGTLGFKPKKDFIEKYNKIDQNLKNKKGLTKIFNDRKMEFFDEINREKYENIVEFEILENKRLIKENLGKEADVLAYPWGHKYKGKTKNLEKLGVKMFVMTTHGKNKRKLNRNCIYRICADKYKNIDKFKKIVR